MLVGVVALALVASVQGACSKAQTSACDKIVGAKPKGNYDFMRGNDKKAYCEWAKVYYGCLDGCASETDCKADFHDCPGSDVCTASASTTDSSDGGSPAPADYGEDEFDYEKFSPHAPFFGFMGAAAALVFANMGAAYGTAKSGRGISTMGVLYPSLVMKHIIPVVMAGVLGIYGLIIAVIIGNGVVAFKSGEPVYTVFKGFAHLGGGLACGLSGLAAGMAIGIVGDYGVRSAAEQPKLYVGMVLVLIFSEALGLYGLIVGLILTSKE